MKLLDLLLEKGVDVDIEEKAAAELALHLLGDQNRDSTTAAMVDKCIKGGKIFEIMDGPTARINIRKLRKWAMNQIKT